MRIFVKRAVLFKNPANREIVFFAEPLVIHDAPDWIAKDRMFDMLLKDGSLEVLKTREAQLRVESEGAKTKESSEMEDLKAEAAELGITVHPRIGLEKLRERVEQAREAK